MNRTENFERVKARKESWDIIVIGGGATGIGCALDAATRGFDVLLLERSDFGKGTSSRSTKLIHGGVRYLKQGNISLVREALKERGILLANAPQLVHKLPFIIPCFSHWQKFYYGIGLKVYDLLSGKCSFGRSRILSKKETLKKLPNVKHEGLSGGVLYFDGQFDDARLLNELAKTASAAGAVLINYANVFDLIKTESGRIEGVEFTDEETGELFDAKAAIVINATGAFCDAVRELSDKESKALITPSQGIHLVFEKSFLQSSDAIMIPKTSDGRVLFAIPFHGKTLVGTTDTPVKTAQTEPKPLETEIEFILETIKNYLAKPPLRSDVKSLFAGIRPLVQASETTGTAALSRDHTIEIDASNLLTITGGKWTTYRNMAEDAIDHAIKASGLQSKKCVSQTLKLKFDRKKLVEDLIREDAALSGKIHSEFEYRKAEIVFAVRYEMARTVEDVLARRTRILFLDAAAALECAPPVAQIMAKELHKGAEWVDEQIEIFNSVAKNYLI